MTKSALLTQQKLVQLAFELQQEMQQFSKDPSLESINSLSQILQDLEHPIRSLEYADEDDRSMELLRALEIHGAGLLPFSFTDMAFKTKDLLITAARNLAIVTAVNEKGEIAEVAGSGQSKAIVAGEFTLTWRPARRARVWLSPGEEAAPAYSDIDQAMVYIMRQWGNRQSDAGHDVTTGVGFFIDLVNAPGLNLDGRELYTFSDPNDVIAYCEERGDGLQTCALDTKLVAGDFILLKKHKAWGVVTRSSADGRLDALVGGMPGKGQLRESAGAARVVRGLPLADVDKCWRPEKKRAARAPTHAPSVRVRGLSKTNRRRR